MVSNLIFSYFQDRFPTTHYLIFIGDNGTGKSYDRRYFEIMGYRGVKLTDTNAANISRLLGKIEPGQCILINDEAEKIDQSQELLSILKAGYSLKARTAKINTNTWSQEYFYPYGLKIMLAESQPRSIDSAGFFDRTFVISCYLGDPAYDLKEVIANVNDGLKSQLYEKILSLRKRLLIYRMLHFYDYYDDIDTGLKGRNKELCKPLLQIFFKSKYFEEVKSAL